MSKIYGSLAVIPIFLFWLYLIWIIIFLSLEISYVHQHNKRWGNGDLKKIPGPIESIELGLAVFLQVAGQFDDGNTYPSAHKIANTLSITEDSVSAILKRFTDADLIYETDEPVRKLFPSRSLNKILLKDVFEAILGNHALAGTANASGTVKDFLSAGYDIIGARTVEDFLKQS